MTCNRAPDEPVLAWMIETLASSGSAIAHTTLVEVWDDSGNVLRSANHVDSYISRYVFPKFDVTNHNAVLQGLVFQPTDVIHF